MRFPIVAKCPRCGANNKPGAKFCNECAAPLNCSPLVSSDGRVSRRRCGRAAASDGAVLRSGRLDRDRAQLDPEEWRETVAGYHRAAAEAIARFGGHVAKYLGDGVMAYLRLSRGARQRRRAGRARGPGDSRRHREAQRATRAPQARRAGRHRFRCGGGGRRRGQGRRRLRRHAQYRRAGAGGGRSGHGADHRAIRIG